jgi:hypothetical protein
MVLFIWAGFQTKNRATLSTRSGSLASFFIRGASSLVTRPPSESGTPIYSLVVRASQVSWATDIVLRCLSRDAACRHVSDGSLRGA